MESPSYEAFWDELLRQADEARREAGKLIPAAVKVRAEAKKAIAGKKNSKK